MPLDEEHKTGQVYTMLVIYLVPEEAPWLEPNSCWAMMGANLHISLGFGQMVAPSKHSSVGRTAGEPVVEVAIVVEVLVEVEADNLDFD